MSRARPTGKSTADQVLANLLAADRYQRADILARCEALYGAGFVATLKAELARLEGVAEREDRR